MSNLSTLWSTLTEVDVGEIRQQVEQPLRMVVLSTDAGAAEWLVETLLANPFQPTSTPRSQAIWVLNLPATGPDLAEAARADLALVLAPVGNTTEAEGAFRKLRTLRANQTVIIVHLLDEGTPTGPLSWQGQWRGAVEAVVQRSAPAPLAADLIPALVNALPEQHVRLAHYLPALRPAVVEGLIRDTCRANATYAGTTGVAEIMPVLSIPLNVADIVILTKNQVLLTYKVALSLGEVGTLQEIAGPVGVVLGSGFVWRQMARTLVGFVPVIGVVPKVAVAYAGTYVIGQAVFAWYARGQKLEGEQLRALYAEAIQEARAWMAQRVPKQRPRLPQLRIPHPRLSLRRRSAGRCPHCGGKIGNRHQFCPHCGYDLRGPEEEDGPSLRSDQASGTISQ